MSESNGRSNRPGRFRPDPDTRREVQDWMTGPGALFFAGAAIALAAFFVATSFFGL